MSGIDVQDYNVVVIGKRNNRGSGGGAGGGNAGGAKQPGVVGIGGKLESGAARKLDDNEAKAPDTVGKKVGQAISTARQGKGWDQVDLANQLALTKAVIVQLEQGVHKKDNKLLQRLEKKLGIWLTGESERVGDPKAEKEKKTASPGKGVEKKKKSSGSKVSDTKDAKGADADADDASMEDESDESAPADKAKRSKGT